MSTLKTTNLQESNASSANIVLGTGSGGGATISGVTTTTTLQIADSIIHTGDTNTKIRFPNEDTINLETGGSTRLEVTDATALSIHEATDKVVRFLGSIGEIGSVTGFQATNTANSALTSFGIRATDIRFASGNSERVRIDSSGRLVVNQTSNYTVYADSKLQISATDSTAAFSVTRWSGDGSSPYINLGKSRGGIGAYTIVQDGDRLGQINFCGADGTDLASHAASISAYVDGTPGSNDMPGRLVFATSSDGGIAETERMRLDSSGDLGLGTADPDARLHVQSAAANNSHTSILATGNGNDRWTFGVGTGPDNSNSDGNKCIRAGLYFDTGFVTGTTFQRGGSGTTGQMILETNQTERFRINADGKIQINNASASTGTAGGNYQCVIKTDGNDTWDALSLSGMRSGYAGIQCMPGADATYYPMYIRQHDDAYCGKISCYTNNTVSYDNASDYRLKQNDVPITDGIAKVKLLRPIRFEMKSDPGNQLEGFFAHEVQAAVPLSYAANGTKDQVDSDNNPVYQGMDYGKITPILTAALKEAIAEIETLKTKVAALESA